MPPKWWDQTMSRVIAIVACGFSLAACSASMPSLDFLKSAPPTEALRIESEPPGADAKMSSGQSCRTPCELTVQASGEVSVTLALNGYQPQTVSVRPEAPAPAQRDLEGGGTPRLAPNPVYVELQPAVVAPPARKPAVKKRKPVTTAARPATTAAPVTASAPAATVSPTPEPAASATNYPWPTR
jgi:PEGA domain